MLNRIILRFGHKFCQPLSHKKFNSGVLQTENSSKQPIKCAVEFHEARLHFCADSKFASVELIQKDSDSILDVNGPLRIPLVWLRDHCRNVANFNEKTKQRKGDCTKLFNGADLADDCYPINFDIDNQKLHLHWADGLESCFLVQELLDCAIYSKKKNGKECLDDWEAAECPSRTLWTGESLKEVPNLSCKNFDFSMFARLFVRFGVVAVNGVEVCEKATRELCESIAPIHNTFFGDFWTFGTGKEQSMAAFDDTAYGNEGIGPHTDGTYFDQPPGIQVFHCLRPSIQGGSTILVDGFSAAERLRMEGPEYFRILSQLPIEHHYLEGKILYSRSALEPVIRQFPRVEKIAQIRFNPYDRAPMRSLAIGGAEEERQKALEETVLFYESYQRFARIVNDPTQQVQIRLRPGTVLFIDNFRIFHGRQTFQGERTMCGCYLSRDCLLARARPLLSPNLYGNV